MVVAAAEITVVAEGESDIYELFARRSSKVRLVVRAAQDRRIETAGFNIEEAEIGNPRAMLSFAGGATAAWVIARLGGWNGYYGKPGSRVMQRGLEDFQGIKYGATPRPPNV